MVKPIATIKPAHIYLFGNEWIGEDLLSMRFEVPSGLK